MLQDEIYMLCAERYISGRSCADLDIASWVHFENKKESLNIG